MSAAAVLPEWPSHGVGHAGSACSQSCHCITTGAPPRCCRDRITPVWGAGVAMWLSPCPEYTTHDKSLFTIPTIREVERSVIQTHMAFPDHHGRCWDLPFKLFPSLLHTNIPHGSVSPGCPGLLFLLPCPQRHQSQGPGPLTTHPLQAAPICLFLRSMYWQSLHSLVSLFQGSRLVYQEAKKTLDFKIKLWVQTLLLFFNSMAFTNFLSLSFLLVK